MELVFIRHTQVALEPGICYGWSDVDTASTFQEEAKKVADSIAHEHFDRIYSSPLHRCQKLASFCGFTPILDNRLKELNFGEWELKFWSEITDPHLEKWYKDWIHTPTNGGESFIEQYTRVISFINEIKQKDIKKVCIFTHRGVIACALIYAGKCYFNDAFIHDIPYGSKTSIIIS